MKIFRKTALLFLLVFGVFTMHAQTIQQYIPQDADFVFSMNLDNLNKKISFDKLKEFAFYKDFMKGMESGMSSEDERFAKLVMEPSSYGIDVMSETFLFGKLSEEASLFGFVFNIENKKSFNDFIQNVVMTEMKGVKGKMGKFQTITEDEATFAWTDKVGMVIGGELNGWGDEREARKALVPGFVKSVLNSKKKNSILKNKDYTKAVAKNTSDFRLWMDYDWLMKMQFDGSAGMFGDSGSDKLMEGFKELYKEASYLIDLNFNEGEIVMDAKFFTSKESMSRLRKLSTGELNKNFFKYLPKDNMMGYFAFAMDLEEYADVMFQMFNPMIEDMGTTREEMEKMAIDGLGQIGVDIDQKGLYEIIKGDMVLAVTGMQDFKITKTQYDENFDKVEVETIQTLPEVVLMMSYGRQNDVDKIIQTGIDAGLLSKLNNEAYKLAVPIPDVPMEFYIVMRDGVFFLTNNGEIANGKLSNGYSKKMQITKDQRMMMEKNNGIFYWDIPQTLNAFAEYAQKEGMLDQTTDKLVNVSKQSMESIIFRTDREIGDYHYSEFSFNFVNKDMNGLEQLFNYINEIYLTTQNTGGM